MKYAVESRCLQDAKEKKTPADISTHIEEIINKYVSAD